MSVSERAGVSGAAGGGSLGSHSFLLYERFRYLKIAAAAVGASVLLYVADVPYGTRYGGTWAGYVLGTAGALLILWLTWYGYRKRTYLKSGGRLMGWLSAHVYLGLALLVIVTLHTGLHFGWNVHTLAYLLMLLVIASGGFGVYCYARYPQLMTENRGGLTLPQMLGRITGLDNDLRKTALEVDDHTASLIARSVEVTEIGGTVRQQVTGRYPHCATDAALAGLGMANLKAAANLRASPNQDMAMRQIRVLLEEKAQLLARARRDVRYRAIMEVWLYIHVPLSFALLATLLAHVTAVFFLW